MTTHEQIQKIEERLRQAMLKSDVTALDQLLSDELIFTDHMGQRVSKEADLEAHRSGKLKIESIQLSEQDVKIYGDTAIVSVLMQSKGRVGEQPFAGKLRFTRVWRMQEASWKVVAAHSSLLNG